MTPPPFQPRKRFLAPGMVDVYASLEIVTDQLWQQRAEDWEHRLLSPGKLLSGLTMVAILGTIGGAWVMMAMK